jgi:FkbM family methyltransferase
MEEWQYKQIKALDTIINPEWTYIDIGAAVGEMLQYFISRMSEGYAFEPNYINYSRLINKFNNNNNVTIINKAISNTNEQIKFWSNGSHMGNILGHGMDYQPYTDFTIVEAITLDSFLIDKSVDFIKIDIEGAEWKLFDGAKNTLASKLIVYQIEFHLDEDWHNREILFDNNYDIYTLDFKKLKHTDPRPYQAILINRNDERFKHILEK